MRHILILNLFILNNDIKCFKAHIRIIIKVLIDEDVKIPTTIQTNIDLY